MTWASVRFTYNDYFLLPEEKRHEILAGDLYAAATPDTKHQRISLNLSSALLQHVRQRKLGDILEAPFDVVLSQENVVQPDILFVRKERTGVIGELNLRGVPDLIIEILSEGSRRKDLEVKRKIYARFGVQEFWVVDPETSTVEVLVWSELGYVSAGLYRRSDRLSSPLLAGLNLPLSEVFQE